jgi:predicted AAA+ superfamily ATPase
MTAMIPRPRHHAALHAALRRAPVVAILGARQVGKTTLARSLQVDGPRHRIDLEDPADLALLGEPGLALRALEGLVVVDEVQRRPDLFPFLRVLADREPLPARFLVLGSASPDLLRQGSESLAGRIAFHRVGGFSLDEVGVEHLDRLWIRGGFPRSFLAEDGAESADWRADFITTFLERDLPQLGITVASTTMRRFWTMLAHWHGQTWNGAELARSFGVSATTVRRYLDHLEQAMVVRVLRPWHENLAKRQVKSPKVYVEDSGLLHALLGCESRDEVLAHPKLGASWAGFAMREVMTRLGARPEDCHFWAAHGGAEVDLLVVRGALRLGFEFKRTDAPRTTRSMHTALADLGLERLDVVHAGARTFPLAERIRAVALERVLEDLEPLRA